MTCVWAAPPTRMSSGLRAHQGVCTHNQGLTCERATWGRVARTPARPPTACAPEWPGPSVGGELRHARVRHAGDTPTERFAWRKTPTGLEGAGGRGGPEGLAAVPGPGRSTRKRQQHPAQANFARNFRRSFFEIAQKRCNSNEVISMFEQVARELRAKLMGEWPVGPQAASHRRACPVSGRSAARPCHGLGCSPGVPRRPSRTRRERTRGRSTGRRAPWPRSCRAP